MHRKLPPLTEGRRESAIRFVLVSLGTMAFRHSDVGGSLDRKTADIWDSRTSHQRLPAEIRRAANAPASHLEIGVRTAATKLWAWWPVRIMMYV
jgi:hypothetical protein